MDKTSLDSVRDEIAGCLEAARVALGSAPGPGSSGLDSGEPPTGPLGQHEPMGSEPETGTRAWRETPAGGCPATFVSAVDQVFGAVKMLEIEGAALLCDEVRALAGGHDGALPDEARHTLRQALAWLPRYLDLVAAGGRDEPLVLLPILNDLRSARGRPLMSETPLFSPDLRASLPSAPEGRARRAPAELVPELERLRTFLQRGLLGWFRGAPPREGIGLVGAVADRVGSLAGDVSAAGTRRLWWVASALAGALGEGALSARPALKRLFGGLDRELKRLAEGGAGALETRPPEGLLKNLLFYAALAPPATRALREVRAAFDLEGAARLFARLERPSETSLDLSSGTGEAAGTRLDPDALTHAVQSSRDQLASIEEALDSFVRDEHRPVSALAPLGASLARVEDTLGLLGLSGARDATAAQARRIERALSSGEAPYPGELLEIASALLEVEMQLENVFDARLARSSDSAMDEREGSAAAGPDGEVDERIPASAPSLGGFETLKVLETVLAESKTDLGAVKDAIASFLAEPDYPEPLNEIPGRLRNVTGGLAILGLERPNAVVKAWQEFVRTHLIERRVVPDDEILDVLADTVVSIEYFLDAAVQSRPDQERYLARAELGIEALEGAAAADVLERMEGEAVPGDGGDPPALSESAPATPRLDPASVPGSGVSGGAIPDGLLEDLERAKDLLARIDAPLVDGEVDGGSGASGGRALERWPPEEPEEPEETEETEEPEEIDSELAGVFLEEAREIGLGLGAMIASWREQPGDRVRLDTIRGRFHALKGSARLVGARAVGELTDVVERVLNGHLAGRIESGDALADLLGSAERLLPGLIQAYATPDAAPPDTNEVVAAALALLGERASAAGAEGVERPRSGAIDGAPGEDTLVDPALVPMRFEKDDEGGMAAMVGRFTEEAGPRLRELGELIESASPRGPGSDGAHPRQAGRAAENEARGARSGGSILRNVRTLRGGARAARLEQIDALLEALEEYLAGRADPAASAPTSSGTVLEAADALLLGDCHRALGSALADVATGGTGAVPGFEGLRRRLEDAGVPAPTPGLGRVAGPSAAPEPVSSRKGSGLSSEERVDLRRAFAEEAGELLSEADRAFRRWRETPQDPEPVGALQRVLHTLKGTARVAGFVPVSDLAHGLESLLDSVQHGSVSFAPRVLELLQRAQDRLGTCVDCIRAGFPLPELAALVAETTECARGSGAGGDALPAATARDGGAPGSKTPRGEACPAAALPVTVPIGEALLERLSDTAGALHIAQSRLKRLFDDLRVNLGEMEQTIDRVRDQLRRLEIETESQILFRHREEGREEEFDPLELDRYSDMQQLSRALSESVSDLASIKTLLDELGREAEGTFEEERGVAAQLKQSLVDTRMQAFARVVPRFERIVRETCRELGRSAVLEVEGGQTRVDRAVLRRLQAPLEHMLRNAVAHGIELADVRRRSAKPVPGAIRVSLERQGHDVILSVADDGAGMDRDAIRRSALERGLIGSDEELEDDALLRLVLEPAVSTASGLTQIAGRGVGMNIVQTEVRRLRGIIEIASTPGEGTCITLRLPASLAVNQALFVEVGGEAFAFPLQNVEAIVRIDRARAMALASAPEGEFEHAGRCYPFSDLGALLGLEEGAARETGASPLLGREAADPQRPVVLTRAGECHHAFLVGEVRGRYDVVVQPLSGPLTHLDWYSGATVGDDGRVVLVFETARLAGIAGGGQLISAASGSLDAAPARPALPKVMVVDDSITVRRVMERLLTRNGMQVVLARDGVEALALLEGALPAVLLLDIEMPRMEGFELARALRDDPRTASLPIIMITSRTGGKHAERARDIGVQGYLGKPFQEEELLELVGTLMPEGEGGAGAR